MAPGGTESVTPVSVAMCAGRPPTFTLSDDDDGPGMTETTAVQGFELGVTGTGQPTIGAPTRSSSQTTGAPPARTLVCLGTSITRPPCTHMMVAFVVTIGGMADLEYPTPRPNRQFRGGIPLLTHLWRSAMFAPGELREGTVQEGRFVSPAASSADGIGLFGCLLLEGSA